MTPTTSSGAKKNQVKIQKFDLCQLTRTTLVFAVVLLALTQLVQAREGTPPYSLQHKVLPLANVQQLVLAPTDASAELAKDAGETEPTPLRFAVAQKVAVTPATRGTWEQVPGGRLWRLRVKSAGATDVNFGFTQFWLPEGATLHIMSETENYYQGPYTARDNEPNGQLWTPVVPGDAAVVELFVPAQSKEGPKLVLSQVSTGYRDLFHKSQSSAVPLIEPCEIDVICPDGDDWRDEIRSVAMYTISGTGQCTGTLIANTANDFRPFFLTANHCGLNAGNASSVVVYWNYQSPACGMLSGGSLDQNQSHAIFRASRADVDFALIELQDVPDCSFNVHYSGWDRSGTAPSGGVGIHHPSGNVWMSGVKCISSSITPLTTVNNCAPGGTGVNTHWNVNWSVGTTEAGSSGSGFWDSATHLDVGFLTAGTAICPPSTLSSSCYGKLSVAWSGPDSSSRLSDWLDPGNTGAMTLPGSDPCATFGITKTASANPAVVGINLTYSIVVTNTGSYTASSVTVTDTLPAGVSFTTASMSQGSWTMNGSQFIGSLGNLGANSNAAISLIVIPNAAGTISNTATVTSGSHDNSNTNNTATVVTTVISNCPLSYLQFTVTYGGQATNVVYYTDGSWDTIIMNGSGTIRVWSNLVTTVDSISFASSNYSGTYYGDISSSNHVSGTAVAYDSSGVPFDSLNFDDYLLYTTTPSSTYAHFTPGGGYLYFLTHDPESAPSDTETVYRWEYVSSLNVARLHVSLESPFHYFPDTSLEYYDFPATHVVCGQAAAYSSLIGTVTDTNAVPISGAQVTFGGVPNTSNAQGTFQYDDIPPTSYLLTISATGYITTNIIQTIPPFNILQQSYALGTPNPGTLQFESPTYTVAEDAGSVRLYVSRTGGSDGGASVSYATSDGTAVAGTNYIATSGSLSWTNGDAADKFFDVPILDNGVYLGNLFFTATLSGASGANLGSPSSAVVTIVESAPPPSNVVVTVQTSPLGLSFSVDGVAYSTAQAFTWTSGSSHTIATTSPQSGTTGTRYVWSNWSDGAAISHTITPTTSGTNTANFVTQYLLSMNLGVGGVSVSPASGFYTNGSSVSISATAGSGYTFSSWTGSGSGSYSGTNNPATVVLNTPIFETANFVAVTNSVFQIISITRQGNNINLIWQTTGGSTNFVQAANGGGYGANPFADISAPIIVLGTGPATTNYVDVGGATNTPARFYRIRSILSTNEDSVGDGIPDWWRAQYFANQPPGNSSGTMTNSESCATCDADGTGQDNFFKYVTGLNPTNPSSVFVLQIANVTAQTGQKNLMYNPITTGRTYTVQFATNVVGAVYTNLTGFTGPQTNGSQATITDTNAAQSNKFYRMEISLP